jgi:hypothetical protein
MLSKIIKGMIEQKFGPVRYPKDCDVLSAKISEACKTSISSSTLKRLFGFTKTKGMEQPRLYTLDIISTYIGYGCWEELIASLDKGEDVSQKTLEKLKPQQIKTGESITITYEPRKVIEVKKKEGIFKVVSSNEKQLLLNDEVKFKLLELHYPLTLTHVIRNGNSIGRIQLATVSGITSIKKG